MSAPADSVSSFIVQHNLMPWLLSYTAVTTIAALRKLGSALKKILAGRSAGTSGAAQCSL